MKAVLFANHLENQSFAFNPRIEIKKKLLHLQLKRVFMQNNQL